MIKLMTGLCPITFDPSCKIYRTIPNCVLCFLQRKQTHRESLPLSFPLEGGRVGALEGARSRQVRDGAGGAAVVAVEVGSGAGQGPS